MQGGTAGSTSTRRLLPAAILLVLLFASLMWAAQIHVCFSPPLPGGCDPLATVVQAIDGARKTVLVQMYALTSRQIVSALVNGKRRGVDVRAIVDRSQLREDRSDTYAVGRLASGGILVLLDTVPGLMHNKVMIVDGARVVAGSFNYTWSAYEWPECPYYDAISEGNRVEFPSSQEAEAAGYRPEQNCP